MIPNSRLLILEDDEFELELYRRMLQRCRTSVEVVMASSLDDLAPHALQAGFDLAICDNRLTDADDYRQTVGALRDLGVTAPVIVVSNDVNGSAFGEHRRHGVAAVLDKALLTPERIDSLLTSLRPSEPTQTRRLSANQQSAPVSLSAVHAPRR